MTYVCPVCGTEAYYDGRCGDGPILLCKCRGRSKFFDDGRGGYEVYERDITPIKQEDYDSWDDWPA